jgi:hypothetical protein
MVGVRPPGADLRSIFGTFAAGFSSTFGAGGGSTSVVGSEAAILSVPAGSERAVIAICSISSASRRSRSARSCKSRPSGVRANERVVRVISGTPSVCSRRWTLLLTADGEIDSDRAAAVKLPSDPTRAKAINPVRRSNAICSFMEILKRFLPILSILMRVATSPSV